MTPSPLGKYLKRTGLSRRQFARVSGLEFSYISRLATGARTPGMDAAVKIQKATGGKVPLKAWRRFP